MLDREKLVSLLLEMKEYFGGCRENASSGSKAEKHFWELQNAASEAAEMLKEQEPRVLSLYEIQTLPNGDETNAPVVTEQRVPIGTWDGGSICQWRGAAFVQETAEDHAYYNWDTYGQNWRCWSGLPTEEQRKAVKWDAAD